MFLLSGVDDDGYPRGVDSKELAGFMGIIASMAATGTPSQISFLGSTYRKQMEHMLLMR